MGPRDPPGTVLTLAEEAAIVAFRRRTLLPLGDVMGCLRDQIPKLTRSSLHRCSVRHGISRPLANETMTKRGRFAETKIGYVHIDHCELRHAGGKLQIFLAITGPNIAFTDIHIFGRTCVEKGINHKLTKPYRPWTNGLAERMNRTIKDVTLKVFHYRDLDSLKAHVLAFVRAYTIAKHLKALRWKHRSRRSRTPGQRSRNLQNQPASPLPGTKHLA